MGGRPKHSELSLRALLLREPMLVETRHKYVAHAPSIVEVHLKHLFR
jgi:hypothetical protein